MSNYWEKRSKRIRIYKGEIFYTISPIPYYIDRSKVFMKLILRELKCKTNVTILDFGCGDGYTLEKLFNLFPIADYYGYDTNKLFLNIARKRSTNSCLHLYNEHPPKKFDIVIVQTVLAHVKDEDLIDVFQLIASNVKVGGTIFLLEHTNDVLRVGDTYQVRTNDSYLNLFNNQKELKIKKNLLISHKAHYSFIKLLKYFAPQALNRINDSNTLLLLSRLILLFDIKKSAIMLEGMDIVFLF